MINLLLPAITGIIEKVIPDKNKAQEISFELATLAEKQAHELAKLQIETNRIEAAHSSIFVSGWRPFTGWICATSLGFNYMCIPFFNYISLYFDLPTVPTLDMSTMMPVLLGMLGLGGLRSFEKTKGVARK